VIKFKSTLKYNEGETDGFQTTLTTVTSTEDGSFELDTVVATGEDRLTATMKWDPLNKALTAQSLYNQRAISLDVRATGQNAATLKFSSPFEDLREVELLGTWTTLEEGTILIEVINYSISLIFYINNLIKG